MLQDHPEDRSWRRLTRLLDRFATWPVLHYGETESLALRRMAQRQGVSDSDLSDLRRRLVDVHARVRSHWRLPLNSYGLKSVAAWRGFRWSQAGADGARALLWWRQWQGEGQRRRGAPMRWIGSSVTTAMTAWRPGLSLNGCWSGIALPIRRKRRNPAGPEILLAAEASDIDRLVPAVAFAAAIDGAPAPGRSSVSPSSPPGLR